MSNRRAFAWVAAIAFAGVVYIVSVIVTGKPTHNGAWLLMVIVFVSAGVDMVVCAFRAEVDEVEQ